MSAYDVVLVHALGRMHNHYLNIARHLGRRLRLGIHPGAIQKQVKTAETERLFLELCASFGAEILPPGPHRARLVVMPQFPWEDGFPRAFLADEVIAERVVAVQTFGYGTHYLDALAGAGIGRLWVYDRQVFLNKLKTAEERRWVDERFEVVEMGAPFARYPVFEDFAADYLVAFPTELSFADTGAKAAFAANVGRLLGEIPPEASVVLKLHNVADGGRLIERGSRAFVLGRRLAAAGLQPPRLPLGGRVGEIAARVAFGARYERVARRTRPLDERTPYFNLGLELFLPGISRGLVTGRSSVVWHALAQRLPVYNCDDVTRTARSEGVLDSYRAFGVPPCQGRLRFDPAAFGRISEGVREADLLELVQKEL